MKIQEQLEKIEALRKAYEIECSDSFVNSTDSIRAFHEWHMAAVEFFCEVLGEEDQLLQKFQSEDVSGNGIDLQNAYHALLATYAILKVKVKKISKQSEIQDMALREENDSSKDMNKPKKIFISHSSKDKRFTHALILLLNTLGFGENDIFCSSEPGYWIKKGNFFSVIKEQFEKNELYVIFVQSPRFYASSVSLNEMGAAWALHSEYYSFLTKDMEFDKMSAVVNNHEIACKVDSPDAKDRLDDWQRDVMHFFDRPEVPNWSIWTHNRDEFLRKVRRMSPKKMTQKENLTKITESGVNLTVEDTKRLKEWVESGNDAMYQLWYEGGSAYFVLGGGDGYTISTGKEMAEWRGFINRLLTLGLIELDGYTKDGKHPEYKLSERAYRYFGK